MYRCLFLCLLFCSFLLSCGTRKKVERLISDSVTADLQLASEELPEDITSEIPVRDTLSVTDTEDDGVIIMNAVKDESGEMVATDVLSASKVVARFRNVAERHGMVDLHFDIVVPERLQDSKWQIRFHPRMTIMQDTVSLESLIVTGKEYRRVQLRGYQLYERFLRSIVTDPEALINTSQLEKFIRRNLPEIYAYKNDTSFVSDELLSSLFGVTEKEATEHYTKHLRVWINEYRESHTGKMYKKYIKAPIVNDGMRLDTVIQQVNGDFIYSYTQTVRTRPQLRKVDITMRGEIFEQEKQVYSVPESGPLTFYISSLSTLVDERERYLTEVIERKVEANTACYIDFRTGRYDIDRWLSYNDAEISRIEENLLSLLNNETLEIDSIVITASASPEGAYQSNAALSSRRSKSVSEYFGAYIRHCADSLRRESGFRASIGDETVFEHDDFPDIHFISRNNPENWQMLDAIVLKDSVLTEADKTQYQILSSVPDPDLRESRMQGMSSYRYMRENLYPRLRTVKFDFHLHRRGMQKDTVHSTVLDSVYMSGIKALKDRDYATAVTVLRPYHDYNSAVAFCCMEYDKSALDILENLEKNAKVNYLLAVLYAREGRDREAVRCFLDSCSQERAYVHRGNLDPEVSALVKRYRLDKYYDTDI